jgi:hypothetical protein
MNRTLEVIIGVLLILYGIFKLIFGTFAVFISDKLREELSKKKPYTYLITNDRTISGKVFDIVLILFGIYTLIHGFTILNIIPQDLGHRILSRRNLIDLHLLLGFILIIFYGLVVFTDIKIPKDVEHTDRYMLEGFGAGLLFLIMIPILAITHIFEDDGLSGLRNHFVSVLIHTIIITIISLCLVFVVKQAQSATNEKKHKTEDQEEARVSEIATLLMIPMNSIM